MKTKLFKCTAIYDYGDHEEKITKIIEDYSKYEARTYFESLHTEANEIIIVEI